MYLRRKLYLVHLIVTVSIKRMNRSSLRLSN